VADRAPASPSLPNAQYTLHSHCGSVRLAHTRQRAPQRVLQSRRALLQPPVAGRGSSHTLQAMTFSTAALQAEFDQLTEQVGATLPLQCCPRQLPAHDLIALARSCQGQQAAEAVHARLAAAAANAAACDACGASASSSSGGGLAHTATVRLEFSGRTISVVGDAFACGRCRAAAVPARMLQLAAAHAQPAEAAEAAAAAPRWAARGLLLLVAAARCLHCQVPRTVRLVPSRGGPMEPPTPSTRPDALLRAALASRGAQAPGAQAPPMHPACTLATTCPPPPNPARLPLLAALPRSPTCRSREQLQDLFLHLAAVNGAPAAVTSNAEALAVWAQELLARAYALQVVVQNIQGWKLVGPEGGVVQLGQPGSVLQLAEQLLGRRAAAQRAAARKQRASVGGSGGKRKQLAGREPVSPVAGAKRRGEGGKSGRRSTGEAQQAGQAAATPRQQGRPAAGTGTAAAGGGGSSSKKKQRRAAAGAPAAARSPGLAAKGKPAPGAFRTPQPGGRKAGKARKSL